MKDEEIVELYWQRSEEAIRQTSAKYETYLSKIAFNVLSDYEDCRECINDTYLVAWNSMPNQRPDVLPAYLGKIIRRLSIDVFRKKKRKKRYASEYALSLSEMEDCFADNETPEQFIDAKLLDEAINSFVHTLPDEARKVFIGRYFFFDSVKRIAAYSGVSETSVKVILFRTRQKLKEYLVKEGFTL